MILFLIHIMGMGSGALLQYLWMTRPKKINKDLYSETCTYEVERHLNDK